MNKKPFEGYEMLIFMKSKQQEGDRIDYWQNRQVGIINIS